MSDPTKPNLVEEFNKRYKKQEEPFEFRPWMRNQVSSACTGSAWKSRVLDSLPFLKIFKDYKWREYLPNDALGGMTVGIMQIPQSMAYAMLAGMPPITGLYTAMFSTFIYFFLGTSRHVSMGTIAVVCLMVGTVIERKVQGPGYLDGGGSSICDDNGYNISSTQVYIDPIVNVYNDTADGGYNDSYILNVDTVGNMNGIDRFDELELRKIAVATAFSLLTGMFLILFSKLRLGFVTTYMSEPLVSGFTTGVAAHVFTSQIKQVFGLKIQRYSGAFKIIKTWIAILTTIAETNLASLAISVICLITLYLVKVHVNQRFKRKLKIPIPIELIVVVIGTLVCHFANFAPKYGIKIVGRVPAGMPMPQLPDLTLVGDCISDAIVIGVVAFAQSVSMAKLLAKKSGYTVDPNQEMFAYGAGGIICSLFSGFVPAGSVSRSVVQEATGGRTQVASLVVCVIILVVVIAVGPLFYNLPTCVLACMIIISLRTVFMQVLDLRFYWRTSKYSFAVWIVVFAGVVILDADIGLGIGILFSLLSVVMRTQNAKTHALGYIPKYNVYKSVDSYEAKSDEIATHVRIIGFQSPIYFANGESFVTSFYEAVGQSPDDIKRKEKLRRKSLIEGSGMKRRRSSLFSTRPRVHLEIDIKSPEEYEDVDEAGKLISNHSTLGLTTIVLECSGINFVDNMGINTIDQVIKEYAKVSIKVVLCACTDEVLRVFSETYFWEKHKDKIYLTLEDVLLAVNSESATNENEKDEITIEMEKPVKT